MTLLLKVLTTLIVLLPATALAETSIASFGDLLQVFYKSGYNNVIEVPQGRIWVHSASDRTPAGTSVPVISSRPGHAERVPQLDYIGENKSILPFMPKEYYRAYKVSEVFLCYQYEGGSYALKQDTFTRCLMFPTPIDEVVMAVKFALMRTS